MRSARLLYLWRWAWTFWPWRITRKGPLVGVLRKAFYRGWLTGDFRLSEREKAEIAWRAMEDR